MGLEPTRLTATDLKSVASASFATAAIKKLLITAIRYKKYISSSIDHFLLNALFTAALIALTDMPYFSKSSLGDPDSPNEFGMPTISTGTG